EDREGHHRHAQRKQIHQDGSGRRSTRQLASVVGVSLRKALLRIRMDGLGRPYVLSPVSRSPSVGGISRRRNPPFVWVQIEGRSRSRSAPAANVVAMIFPHARVSLIKTATGLILSTISDCRTHSVGTRLNGGR